jgi:GNAT superfamily N-acetyltransferase
MAPRHLIRRPAARSRGPTGGFRLSQPSHLPVPGRPLRPPLHPVPPVPRPALDDSRVIPVPAKLPGYAVRDATVSDLPTTARLHVRELRVGLFPRLGRWFVMRWHRAFLQSPNAVSLTVVRPDPNGDERIVGFLIGAVDREAFIQELLTRHRNALLLRGVCALAVRPWVLGRFLRTRLRPYLRRLTRVEARSRRGDPPGAATRVEARIAELTAIVVIPPLRGTGAGRALVQEFLRRCSAGGAPTAELVTLSGPGSAADFYAHTGWTASGQAVTRDGLLVQRFRRPTGQTEGG